MPVLTVFAVQVTARRGDGKNLRARQKMKKGLLFYGVNVDGAGISIDDRPQHAVYIDPDPALPALARLNQAQLRA